MNCAGFDEMQSLNRQKIAFQTLILSNALILLNAVVKEFLIDIWGSPIIEASALISLSAMYFVTMCIWKNAYFTVDGIKSNVIMAAFLILGIILLFPILFLGDTIIQNSKIVNPYLAAGIFFAVVSFQYLIKFLIDKKHQPDSDDE